VDMIPHGIDLDELRIMILENTGDVGVEFIPFGISYELMPQLCAEYEVDDNVCEGL